MYEEHGLMSKITNPAVLAFLRSRPLESHTQIVETALYQKLGVPPKSYLPKTKGHKKKPDCRNVVPVKVTDPGLIEHIISQKKSYGICYRHTIESAILNMMRSGK